MKRFLCALLSMVLILCALPCPVRAEELSQESREELEALLIDSMTTGTPVEIEQFGITVDELESVYKRLLNSGRFPWNADTNFEYVINQTGLVIMFRPKPLEFSQLDEKMYEEKMAELIAYTCLEGMEPWQIILNIHEYIITHCSYVHGTANNSYSALVEGETACYGYSRLFLEVMERLDIPCRIVIAEDSGDGIGHAWNVVQLDGNWYHIDLTWDDPMGCPTYGYSRHAHFLKSDRQFNMESNGHNFPWEVDVQCENEKYSTNPVWDTAESPLVFLDAETMLLRRNTNETLCIYAVDCQTMEETLLYEEDIPVSSLSTGAFLCGSYGLSLYEGRLYFTNSKEVVSILLDGTDRQVEYTHKSGLDSYVISCDVQEGTLYYTLADATGNYTNEEATLSVAPSHVHSYTSQVTAPTCTEDGYTLWSCDCGIQYQTEHTPAGHILSEEVIATEGIEILRTTCQNCDYMTEEESVSPTETTEEPSPLDGAKDKITGIMDKLGSLKWILLGIGGFVGLLILILIARPKKKRR